MRDKLQKSVDAFNNAAVQHEQEVQQSIQTYLATPQMGGNPQNNLDDVIQQQWGQNSMAEIKAKINLYSLLKQAFGECNCPANNDNGMISNAIQQRIDRLKQELVLGPPAP